MNLAVRICLYVLLVLLAGDSFSRFRRAYSGSNNIRDFEVQETNAPVASVAASPSTNSAPSETLGTNSPTAVSQEAPTNTAPAGNLILEAPATNVASSPSAPAKPVRASKKTDPFVYLGMFLFSMLGLGILGAWDVARYLGSRAGKSVMAEDWVERKDPGYEKAEEAWARGNHMDAIELMREYLKKNPGEQHVAIRIAEIYEKDLGNFLAAALELEEVLTKRLPREKWGWTAIRLSNIYSGRLNQTEKAMAILERIVNDYPDTGAAKKARQRLGLPEPEEIATAPAAEGEGTPEEGDGSGPDPSTPSLPKGFRPKK